MALLVAYSTFVDGKYGSDVSGTVERQDLPFATIGEAITKTLAQSPSPSQIWIIQISPGTYNENIVVPDSIYLNGAGPNTIVTSVTANGGTVISNIQFFALNGPAITVNSLNDADVNFLSVVAISEYTIPSLTPISTVNIIKGEGAMQQGAIFGFYFATAPAAYLVKALDGMTFTDMECIWTLGVSYPFAAMYSGSGDKFVVTIGVSTVSLASETDLFAFFDISGAATITAPVFKGSVISNRLTAGATGSGLLTPVDLVRGTGAATLNMIANLFDFTGLSANLLTSVEGIANSSGQTPTVNIASSSFVGSAIPPAKGSISKLVLTSSDQNGSLAITGGFYNNIITVSGNYQVLPSDHSVVEILENSTVTLPNLSSLQSTQYDYGQEVFIKNESAGRIQVVGVFDPTDSSVFSKMIEPGRGYIFQNDFSYWHVFADYSPYDHDHKENKKDKKKCCSSKHERGHHH
jgi:hypothetical protein